MDIESIREYCLRKKEVTESFPFGADTLVFKVCNKMFLLVPLDASPVQFNAKCDPDKAVELREQYACIQPGYHMNKKMWNTVTLDQTLSTRQVQSLIDDSYALVVNALPKKLREGLL